MLRKSLAVVALAFALGGPTAPPSAFAVDAVATEAGLPPAEAVTYENVEQLKALAAKRPTVVYFHAHWCPTCQATLTSLEARWPEVRRGLVLLIADYDKDADLKRAYGVTYQNTFVQVAADGSKLKIWNGGGIETLNSRTQFPQ